VRAIQALAQALEAGTLKLEPMVAVDDTIAQLRALPGFGEWTAQYVAMRALAWPDAFPHSDLGVLKALGETDPRQALARAEAWRPWRAYAVMHLWSTL
jgi:AraC family transcriptional regulator of adaptative response / DNA-3-methyladenine glycosylase II